MLRAPLKIVFFRDCRVSAVLESSCMLYTLRFSVRCFLALTKKSEFLEVPLSFFIKLIEDAVSPLALRQHQRNTCFFIDGQLSVMLNQLIELTG